MSNPPSQTGPKRKERLRHRLPVLAALLPMSGWGCGIGADPPAAETSQQFFVDITAPSQLDFHHHSGLDGSFAMPQSMGSGGAIWDYDGDGDLDVYLVDSGSISKTGLPSGAANRLFQRQPDGSYTDVTSRAGVGDAGFGMGCAVGDIDNDGDLDLFVSNFGPDHLYRNNGDGTFSDISESAGIRGDKWSTSADFFDYDRDGFLDLYVAAYVLYDPTRACNDASGQPEFCGPEVFAGVPDTLYRNNGDGTFTDQSSVSGVAGVSGKGLGVVVSDFDGDGWPDVYVANDGQENLLWINQRDGRFENDALIRGSALNLFGRPEASMGLAVGDIDGDGDLDLFVTHLDRETNTLYRNLGGAQFEDQTADSDLANASLPFTGFGTTLFDYDHDGDLDLFVANGRVRRGAQSLASRPHHSPAELWRQYAEPNQLFENEGVGKFTDVSFKAGEITHPVEVSRSVVAADIDGDGDLDLLLTQSNGPVRLWENRAPKLGSWLQIRALDPTLNRDAIGAVVTVSQNGLAQMRVVTSNASYLAGGPPVLHYGLPGPGPVGVQIQWPDGSQETLDGIQVNQMVALKKAN